MCAVREPPVKRQEVVASTDQAFGARGVMELVAVAETLTQVLHGQAPRGQET